MSNVLPSRGAACCAPTAGQRFFEDALILRFNHPRSSIPYESLSKLLAKSLAGAALSFVMIQERNFNRWV